MAIRKVEFQFDLDGIDAYLAQRVVATTGSRRSPGIPTRQALS
mgnify:CR=1 FL=1